MILKKIKHSNKVSFNLGGGGGELNHISDFIGRADKVHNS